MTAEFLKSSDAFEKIFRPSPAAMAIVDTEEFKTIDIPLSEANEKIAMISDSLKIMSMMHLGISRRI